MRCDDCGRDTPDTLRRAIDYASLVKKGKETGTIPALCTACCSTYPGRQWMAQPDPVKALV